MALSLRTALQITSRHTVADGDSATGTDAFTVDARTSYTDGTGATSANTQQNDVYSVTTSGTTIDLKALTGRVITPVALSKVREFYAACPSTNTGTVTLGGAASAPWVSLFGTLTVPPGGTVYATCTTAAALGVTTGTALKMIASTGTQSVTLYFAGE